MEKYILAPYVRFGYEGAILYAGFGSNQKIISDIQFGKLVLKASNYWIKPRTELEVINFLKDNMSVTDEEAEKVISFLFEGNYVMSADYDKNDRYSRHALYYSLSGGDYKDIQKKLLQKHVMIIGCGGIGTQVSCALATAGVGKITLLDFDKIEISNLTRQILFTEADEGKFKTEVLKRELQKRNSSIIIDTIHKRIESFDEELPLCDLAIISADSVGIVDEFNKYAVKNNIPFLNVGYVQDIAVWGPFVIPGKTGCMACHKLVSTTPSSDAKEIWNSIISINKRSQAPSIGEINMLSASFAVLDSLRFLGGYGEIVSLNRRVGLWTHNMKLEFQGCTKNINCPVCGKHYENE